MSNVKTHNMADGSARFTVQATDYLGRLFQKLVAITNASGELIWVHPSVSC